MNRHNIPAIRWFVVAGAAALVLGATPGLLVRAVKTVQQYTSQCLRAPTS